ncbi:MAG: MAC/perforin domain-containing protein [Bacteroidales bacterium]|nr:MAC/perforin domain-containing protein [Bacteroidales bacterium]
MSVNETAHLPLSIHTSFLATMAVVLVLTSCSKLPGPFDPFEDPETIDGFKDLGAGYDVFDNFADAAKVREHILDYQKLNADGLVEKKDLENSSFLKTSGTSISTYSSSLSASVGLQGSYMFFSGSIETNFSKERYSYDSYSFATYHILINKYQLKLPTDWDVSALKAYMTTQARSKINDPSVPPSAVFSLYGTHCMTGVVVGARSDYSVSGRTRDVKESVNVSVYAEASFSKGFGSGTLNTSVITQQEFDRFASNMEQHLEVYGGDSQLGHSIISKNDYDAWLTSVPNKLVFCNYTQNGLIPVWEFCDDEGRRNELLQYYSTSWATDRKISVFPTPRFCILDLKVIDSPAPPNPYKIDGRDYYKLPYDLNRGAGGATLWIYYLPGLENDNITPLAAIGTVDTSDGENLSDLGTGFVMINVDLNKGAGGDLIYLAFRRRSNHSDQLVTGLAVWNRNTWVYSMGTSSGYTWYGLLQHGTSILQDLNEDAGGNFIHLYSTTQFVEESALPGK